MFKNYLKTCVRNLVRNRAYSFISILGLAIGMSVSMVLIMLVADQMSYDRHNTIGERIYRINTIGVDSNGQVIPEQENASSPMALAPELLAQYAGVENAVRLMNGFGNGWSGLEDKQSTVPLSGFFADAEVLNLFQYELEYGDKATALVEPYSVVLTRKTARKLFDAENPVGQIVHAGDLGTYKVTGVLKETSTKSHIVFEALASMATVSPLEQAGKLNKTLDSWTNPWDGWTYIAASPGKTTSDLQSMLDQLYNSHSAELGAPGVYHVKFQLQPLFSITPGNFTNNPIGPQLPWVLIYILGGLALIILLTACFNFTNLAIARSLTRAREIGVRKVTGAGRFQIFSQFISETVVIALVALVVAMALVKILEPLITQLNLANLLQWSLSSSRMVYAVFLLFATGVGILAGFFPALILSGFQPVHVLKNLNNAKLFSRMRLRKVLLVTQFTTALFFILTVITAHQQLHLFMHQDHGFNLEHNIAVRLNGTSAQQLKTELAKYPTISSISATSHLPAAGTSFGTAFKRPLEANDFIPAAFFAVDEHYAENMQLRLVAGRFFSNDPASNQKLVVINETAVQKFQFTSPHDAIGKLLIHQRDSTEKIIVGVVADYNHRTLTHEIEPLALLYAPSSFEMLQVSYIGGYDQACRAIETAWANVNPGLKADYSEVISEVNKFYDLMFGDMVKVLSFISFIALFLSCLGLLGITSFAIETRLREVSIRKLLGSGDGALVLLLSRGFLSVLGFAIAIGLPLAYLANNLWLEFIAYRTQIGPGTISLAVALLAVFGVVTIASQTWRAVSVKPVERLKNDT